MINLAAGTSYQQSTLPFGTAFNAESGGYSNQVFTSYDRSAGTGLDYAVNRTYSSGQSRFTQPDPIGMAAASIGNPQSNNMYAYVQNMPTDFVDPSGLNMEIRCSVGWEWRPHMEGGGDWILVERCYGYEGGGDTGRRGPPDLDPYGGGGNGPRNDCISFANKAASLAKEYLDQRYPNWSKQVQNFMNDLVSWGSEYTSATAGALVRAGGSFTGHPHSSGFRSGLSDSYGPSSDQVRHALGGLLAGYVGGRVGQRFMTLRESDWWDKSPKESHEADLAMNALTVPMGRALAGDRGIQTAVDLGAWIRNNLCEPISR